MSSKNLFLDSLDKNVASANFSWQDNSSQKSPSTQRAEIQILDSNESTLYDFIKLMLYNIVSSPVSSQLSSGARVLYVSAGDLQWIKEICKAYPKSDFECLTIVNTITDLKDLPENIKCYSWNVQDKTLYADSVFDFVNLDSMLFHLRTEEWPTMLHELRRIIKPGGFIELLESEIWGGNMGPTNEIFTTTLIYSLRARGIYARAARELGKLLEDAGYINIVHYHISVPCGWGSPIGKAYGQLTKRVISLMFPFIMKSLAWTEERLLEECSNMEHEWAVFETYNNFYKAYAQKP